MTFNATGSVVAHIRSHLASLIPTEQAVALVLIDRPDAVIEMSSQQVAAAAGTSRATVVRACQSLGFTGYQQLRVMLARDLGPAGAASSDGTAAEEQTTLAGTVRASFAGVGTALPAMTALLDDEDLNAAVRTLADARRVLVCGNGLSGPLAQLAAHRLLTLDRSVDAPADTITQQIVARHMTPEDALLAISGSGANEITARCATVAHEAGATVVLVTAFRRSPLVAVADVSLVVGMRDPTFRDELTVTTRIPQLILIEGLVAGVARRRGKDARAALAAALDVVAGNLAE